MLDAARAAGLGIASPCGGRSKCGRCVVRIGKAKTPVRACETPAEPGMVVEIPSEAAAEGLSILKDLVGRTGVRKLLEAAPREIAGL